METASDFIGGTVYFAGAGPGDAELITLKARRLVENAGLVLYAGSLVNPAVLQWARPGAKIVDSARLSLAEQIELMVPVARAGGVVARLHTGDPSIFGSITEQMRALEKAGVPFRIIPGVSSAFAAAAALGLEYTQPGVTQSVIFTRAGGRTPVPERENLRRLAASGSSLVIFLSAGMISEVAGELRGAGYAESTPVAVVYRASWPDELVICGTLATIVGQCEKNEITHQALIIVSPVLGSKGETFSHLYGAYQKQGPKRSGVAILAVSSPAVNLGRRLLPGFPGASLFVPERLRQAEDTGREEIRFYRESLRQVLQEAFTQYDSLVCIMAAGIVARELAPLLQNKHSDPGVVVMDAEGKFAISLLGGHEGGANNLARKLADLTGGQAVITTCGDVSGIPPLDEIAGQKGWKMHPRSRLARVMTRLIEGDGVVLIREDGADWFGGEDQPAWAGVFASWEEAAAGGPLGACTVTYREPPEEFWKTFPEAVVFHPCVLAVGVGCNRGTPGEEIVAAITAVFADFGLSPESVRCLATLEEKAAEAGIQAAAQKFNWEVVAFHKDELRTIQDVPTPSGCALKIFGVAGVAEPAAMLAAHNPCLLVEKQKFRNVTVAVGIRKGGPGWEKLLS